MVVWMIMLYYLWLNKMIGKTILNSIKVSLIARLTDKWRVILGWDTWLRLNADTRRTRFGHTARFFIFQKQINRCTIETETLMDMKSGWVYHAVEML